MSARRDQRVGILVNDLAGLNPQQATAMLAHALTGMVREVAVFGVGDLGVDSRGQARAWVRRADPSAHNEIQQINALKAAERVEVDLDYDIVLIRTNPARDTRSWAHEGALQVLSDLRDAGVRVINDPDGLRRTGSKIFLGQLPEWTRPRMLVSADETSLEEFVRASDGPCVLKPVAGTRGSSVFKVSRDDPNLHVILDVVLRNGFVIAQAFVPQAVGGDTRVVVLDGKVLEINGVALAINRVPRATDFRSNIAVGGLQVPGRVTDGMRAVVAAVGPILVRHGVRLGGLDFLGDYVCEVNVFSTGGFVAASRFFNQPFTRHTLEVFLDEP